MPRKKGRRGESSKEWEGHRSEDNDSSTNNSNGQIGDEEFDEYRGENEDDAPRRNNVSGPRARRNKAASSVKSGNLQGLGPWTEAVTDTVLRMGAAHEATKSLQKIFMSHENDLRMMEETRESLKQLEKECRVKGEEIRRQEDTITTLSGMTSKNEEKIEREMKKLEQEKQDLERAKAKSEKRIAATMAEERVKLKSEVEKLIGEQGQSHDKRKKELEVEYNQQRDENNRQVTVLGDQNMQLTITLEEQRKANEINIKKLEETEEFRDILKRAMDSFKAEMLKLEKAFELMKTEFALNDRPTEYFTQKFADIYQAIEDISLVYFDDIEGKDLDGLHEELIKADCQFEFVPIDTSEESRSLRIAHAQRIMSEVICDIIWKPFRSEFTLSHPGFDDLLSKMLAELAKFSQGGRAANVWTSLTMRALHCLPADSDGKEPHHSIGSVRAEQVVSKVYSRVSPLVSLSHCEDFRNDLLKLANLAIDIWDDAQTGESEIIIQPVLDPTRRDEWRSLKFDPVSSLGDYDNTIPASLTKSQVLTLFPRVVSVRTEASIENETGPPCSWPSDADRRPRTLETCIHYGVGLSEFSPLVLWGKEVQEEKKQFISKAIETAKKEIHNNRRFGGQGGRNSMGSSTVGSLSPSQQWKSGSIMKSTER